MPTFAESFMQMHPGVFAQVANRQTNKDHYIASLLEEEDIAKSYSREEADWI